MKGVKFFLYIGDWSNGMIGVSKTFGGSSILSSPADKKSESIDFTILLGFYFFDENKRSLTMSLFSAKYTKIEKGGSS